MLISLAGGGFQAVHLGLDTNTPLNIFHRSSTHVQLANMSQHPQQIVHYAARSVAKDAVTKQNGMPVIEDDDNGHSDDDGHNTNHNR